MSGVQNDVINILHHFSTALLHNPLAVQSALRKCKGADGTYNMLSLVDCLMKLPAVRGSLSCQVQLIDNISTTVAEEPYGAKLVNFMLTKEKNFLSFRCSYYLLYQSFAPTTIHVILERYTIPKSFETQLLKQFNWRTVNQSLLNYLLIELRKSKDEATFWETLRLMIEEPQLRRLVDNYALPKRNVDVNNKEVLTVPSAICDKKNVTHLSEADVDVNNKELWMAPSAVCDKENVTCLSEAALPAISLAESDDDDSFQMTLFLKAKRYQWPAVYQTTSKGSPMDQQKLEMDAEIDRLVDERCLSYNEAADICLKVVGPEKKLFHTSPGDSEEPVVLCPHCAAKAYDEMPFFMKYSELAEIKPNMFEVFKKYNNVLLDNFPENYMTSLEIIYQTYPVAIPSKMVEYITTPTSYKAVNQRLFELLVNSMLRTKGQERTIDFVIIIKAIIKDFDKNAVLKRFENELMYAIAQDTSDAKLSRDNSKTTQVKHSDYNVHPDHSQQWVDNALYQSTPTTPVKQIEEFSDIMFSEPHNLDRLKPKTLAVIKKYYVVLLKSFPKDHMTSLGRYLKIRKLSDETVDFIISAGNSDQANRRLFGYMTCVISPEHEDSLFTFCSNLEDVIGNPEIQSVIEQLRNDLIEAIFEDVNKSNQLTSHDVPQLQSQYSSSSHHSLSSQSPLHSLSPHQSLSSHQSLVSQQPLSQQPFSQQPLSQQPLSQQPLSSQQLFHDWQQAPALLDEYHDNPDDLHFNMAYELVGSMPKDFKKTMGYIRQHFTDDEANDILSSSNHFAANEKIVGTLLLHIKQNEDIYKFWNIIESIKDAPQLSAAVESVKKKLIFSIYSQGCVSTSGTTGISDDTSIPHSTQRLHKDESMSGSLTEQNRREKLIALVNKHYSALLKSIPEDFSIEKKKLLSHGHHAKLFINYDMYSQINNEIIFNKLVNQLVSPDSDMTPVSFCCLLLMLIGDVPAVRELQKDVLELVDRETASKAKFQFKFALSHRSSIKEANQHVKDDQDIENELEITLSSFDDCYDLLLKINPRFAKDKFTFSFKFEHGDPLTGNLLFQHNEIQMEVLLVHVKNSIATYGINCFLKLIDILCNQEPYKEIGFHILDAYHAKGGQQIPTGHYARTGDPLPIEELTRRLEYHSRQLLAGLQYQPPKPLPPYHVPRPNLLSRMVKAVMDSDIDFGVDLAIFSLPGYGKSTLVKALCYHNDITQYFLDGFLWIKLGIGTINHHSKLMKIYYQLTAMTFTGDQNQLVDKLKNLVTNHLQRLLVIISDVYMPDDVILYLEIFRNCKVILLSTKEELCPYISVKQKILLGIRDTDIVMSLKLLTMDVKGFENINNELFAQLRGLAEDLFHWPILLNIVHHQLLLHCNKHRLSLSHALQKIVQKLMASKKGSKNDSVDCTDLIIEGSLEFLENKDICCLNELLYSGGPEYVTPKCLIPHLWKVTEDVANQRLELLYSCGLVQYTEKLQLTETSYSVMPCVEVHYVVVQHLLLKMNKTAFM